MLKSAKATSPFKRSFLIMIRIKGVLVKRDLVKLFLILGLVSTLSARSMRDIASTAEDKRAFVLQEDAISIRGAYHASNGSLDLFNLNGNTEAGNIYSAINNATGLDFSVSYGLHRHISLYYNFQAFNINYAGEKLKNRQNDIYTRINFYDDPQSSFDDFSLDLGYIRNASTDLNPQIANLSDNSFYMRLLLGSRFQNALLNFYMGFKYSSIDTTLFSQDASRDEKAINIGITHTVEFSNFILDTGYEYLKLFSRESNVAENKSNQIITLKLSRAINDKLLIYIGESIMLNQFNGIIPYLYNAQTQSAFDKTYNYLSLGFVYNFGTSSLIKSSPNYGTSQCNSYRGESSSLFSFFGW